MGIMFEIFIFAGTSPVSNDLFIKIMIDSHRPSIAAGSPRVFVYPEIITLNTARPELRLELYEHIKNGG